MNIGENITDYFAESKLVDSLDESYGPLVAMSFECARVEDQYYRAADTLSALHVVSSDFMGAGDVSNEALDRYTRIVGAVVTASGISIPTQLMVPSFEAEDKTSNGAEKKIGVFRRILNWLREWGVKVKQMMKNFFTVAKKEFVNVGEGIDGLKQAVGLIKDGTKPSAKYSATLPTSVSVSEVSTIGSVLSKNVTDAGSLFKVLDEVIGRLGSTKIQKDDKQLDIVGRIAGGLRNKPYVGGRVVVNGSEIYYERPSRRKQVVQNLDPISIDQIKTAVDKLEALNDLMGKDIKEIEARLNATSDQMDKVIAKYTAAEEAWSAHIKKGEGHGGDKKAYWAEWDKLSDELEDIAGMRSAAEVHRTLSAFARDLASSGVSYVKQSANLLKANISCYKAKAA